VAQSKFVQEIKWNELNWSDDAFIMQPYPSNLLPTTPAGRLAKTIELMDRGLISQSEGKKLLEFPDIKSISVNSPYDDAVEMVERALEKGEYESPEPLQDLSSIISIGISKYLEGRRSSFPESHLEVLRKLIEDAQALQQELASQQEPVAPASPPVV
jgi:hypothetical protein